MNSFEGQDLLTSGPNPELLRLFLMGTEMLKNKKIQTKSRIIRDLSYGIRNVKKKIIAIHNVIIKIDYKYVCQPLQTHYIYDISELSSILRE